MSYTIDYFYLKFLDRIDKEGSEIISISQVMELLQTETYNFIEQTVRYLENTQQIKDFILPLNKPYSITLTLNPDNIKELLGALPGDYLHLETAFAVIPGKTTRVTKIVRRGEMDINKNNPNKKPTDEYPKVIEYESYIVLYGSSVNVGVKIEGFYITKPTFGNADGNTDTEIVVNLPDNTVEKIMNLMVTSFHERTADQRFEPSLRQELGFGQTNR